jgi:transposase
VHTAKAVKNYFEQNNINVLPWPARSTDLNIIENVWGQLARNVYRNCRQYNSVEELKIAIREDWNEISRKHLKILFKSLPKRMLEVIKKKESVHIIKIK